MKHQALSEIDQRFEQTWALLAREAKHNKIGDNEDADLSIRKLMDCLKWCTAYAALQTTCSKIITPYHKQPGTIIKWFWIEYNEMHDFSDVPPTPADFFDWYCNSATIVRERSISSGKRTRKPRATA